MGWTALLLFCSPTELLEIVLHEFSIATTSERKHGRVLMRSRTTVTSVISQYLAQIVSRMKIFAELII